jgi:hypothetical protein
MLDVLEDASHADVGGETGLDVDVGGVVLDGEVEEFLEVHVFCPGERKWPLG